MISSINGRRELGKSTLALHLARRRATRVIFDPRFLFKTSNVIVRIVDANSIYELLNTEKEIIIQPDSDVAGNFERTCNGIKLWILDHPLEPICFLIDEASFVDTPNYICESLSWILRCTPRKTVDIIFTAHRPADIAVGIRAIADFWYMFRITQENDLKVIQDRCGSEIRDMLPTLEDNELIVWNDSVGTWRKESNRIKWYVPMTAQIQNVETAK
jgi:hypothetical protein